MSAQKSNNASSFRECLVHRKMSPHAKRLITRRGVSVLIVDDCQFLRQQLRLMLMDGLGYEVLAEANDGLEAIRLVAELRPDVVLMDISMPRMNGLEATAQVTQRFPETRVIIHSSSTEDRYVRAAFQVGAAAYLVKGSDVRLDVVIDDVAAGRKFIDPSVSQKILGACHEPAPHETQPLPNHVAQASSAPAVTAACSPPSASDAPDRRGCGMRLLAHACAPQAGQPLRIVMVNGDDVVMTYLWDLTVFFSRMFPLSLPEWTHWSFTDLEAPNTADVAAGSVAVADWVVFCQATSAPLPLHVQSWIERCLGEMREHKATLGLLTLTDDLNETNQIQTYLEGLASRGTKYINVRDALRLFARSREQQPPGSSTTEVPYD